MSLSSLSNTDSMSCSPKTFFAYFSATGESRAVVNKDRPTESTLVDLFSRKGEHCEHFGHNLDHRLSHSGGKQNIGIDPESSKKALDAFEGFY